MRTFDVNATPETDAEVTRLYDAKNWNAGKAFDHARRLERALRKAVKELANDDEIVFNGDPDKWLKWALEEEK